MAEHKHAGGNGGNRLLPSDEYPCMPVKIRGSEVSGGQSEGLNEFVPNTLIDFVFKSGYGFRYVTSVTVKFI